MPRSTRLLRLSALCAPLVAVLFALSARSVAAQTAEETQPFDYSNGAAQAQRLPEKKVDIDYSEAELVNDPSQGAILVSKNRRKNWVNRSLYILILDLALMAILFTLSKTEEHNLIAAYVISGMSACLGFWMFLCSVLLFALRTAAWLAIMPLSLILIVWSYLTLMKIRNSDVSLAELKRSFQKMAAISEEDQRLSSVESSPGNWTEEDFLK